MSWGDAYGIILKNAEHDIVIPILLFKSWQTEEKEVHQCSTTDS